MFLRASNKLSSQSSSSRFWNSNGVLKKRGFSTAKEGTRFLQESTLNPRVIEAEYAVRGELVMRAEEHAKTLNSGKSNLPFSEIVFCNIGNPQSLKQKPLTFLRQYVSLMENPSLLESPLIDKLYPSDVLQRAKSTISKFPGMGAYSHSMGLPHVRQAIAKFIENRDQLPSNPDNIYIYNGASPAVQNVLRLIISGPQDGILIPIPQYPLYSASIKLLGGTQAGYYLNESKQWGMEVSELKKAVEECKKQGATPRALVIINPGNPTGQVLNEEDMKDAIRFCHENKMVLMADEVYQENVYIKDQRPFKSFKKVLGSMEPKYSSLELFSFHSISKGFLGECGQRGGYVELTNIDPAVAAQLYKLSSILLCPNTAGQLIMEGMVNPPKQGEASYELYIKERDAIYDSLKRRAQKLTKFLDSLEGVSCNAAEGAMYAFPQIKLPPKAVQEAEKRGKRPDDFYAISLLDATGVVVVPGSGFGQVPGSYHFRTTFLPPEDQIDSVMVKVANFHNAFLKQYQ